MATINTANPDEDFTCTVGNGRIIASCALGSWAGVCVQLYRAAAGTPSVFNAIDGAEFLGPFERRVDLGAGDILRAIATKSGGIPAATSISIQYDEPA